MTHRAEADQPEDPDLADDSLKAFILDGHKYYVRWHQSEDGPDSVVATKTGQWAFADPQSCLSSWPSWRTQREDESDVLDLDDVTVWLRRQRLSVPCEDLLNAWNWADDVARGLELPWADRGALADRCYDKIFAATLPWLVVGGEYRPRWNSREIDFLRRIGTQALTLVRQALQAQG
jgi:hypothetical protein